MGSPIEDVQGEAIYALTSEWTGAQGANTVQVFNALGLDLGSPAPASPQREEEDNESFVFPWLMPAPVSVPMPPTWTLVPPVGGTALATGTAPPLTPPHTLKDATRALRRFRPVPLGRRRLIVPPEDKVSKVRTARKVKALRESLDLARRLRGPTTVFPQGMAVVINSPSGHSAAADAQGGGPPKHNRVMPQSEANRVADTTQSM